jgi:hypothetical protein
MEDFFACTIVVPTANQIQQAEELILSLYAQHSRRPSDDATTHKQSSSFDFDDLRLYVRRQSVVSGKAEDLTGLIFEVQIKTILQHAWTLATHDLIYKTNTVSWPRERVAYQVKAMLEHAEIAIAEADRLSAAQSIAKKDQRTSNILQIIEQVLAFWPQDRLPANIKRLAETINDLLRSSGLPIDQLSIVLNDEQSRIGQIPIGLSPYAFTVQALAHTSLIDFRGRFERANKKFKLVVHSEMDLPGWLLDANDRVINLA